jgi:mono/diheme cytochrome c family protein
MTQDFNTRTAVARARRRIRMLRRRWLRRFAARRAVRALRTVQVMLLLAVLLVRKAHGADSTNAMPESALMPKAAAGYRLFDHNCAHCHGDDARGDEGPDLHDLRKSDEKLQRIIKGGIKGEMPAFGKKFSDTDVEALIAFLRTLK